MSIEKINELNRAIEQKRDELHRNEMEQVKAAGYPDDLIRLRKNHESLQSELNSLQEAYVKATYVEPEKTPVEKMLIGINTYLQKK